MSNEISCAPHSEDLVNLFLIAKYICRNVITNMIIFIYSVIFTVNIYSKINYGPGFGPAPGLK